MPLPTPGLTLIVAIDAGNGIGIRNTLPWRLPEDLAHFKRTTLGHPIVMGRKTFESIGRPLPGRRNIVISRNPQWRHEGVETAASIDAALALTAGATAFVIGGAEIYAASLPRAQGLIVTQIERRFECDAFFPAIDSQQWQETGRTAQHDEKENLDYSFVTYERRSDDSQ
ncbi:dihydrofolate reductase [Herbaspirillum sp. RTI4]|uniref:dihydrofolate reductase n=1 Tax=Herbaspirillum sp. RTI4 TaxID=3048640 RepID=UPI002AB375E6|nr:dihydrofolate reductase [Herbaspirillum sp. RTI4]MDY7578100.1 dihydrofolate reductase [Herbaspirillum sp. RTI4]MEA9980689.1 dihydrofolate reductase [Herbaspirillum sp. RTI4]